MTPSAQQAAAVSASTPVPTPCIGVCELDAECGLCRGCARTTDEIADWQHADNAAKAAIWHDIAGRRRGLAMSTYRLSWSAGEIAAMIESSLRRRWGCWILGAPGASVEFAISSHENANIVSTQTEVSAATSRGAIRLLKHEKTIAVAFGDQGDGEPEAIGLILPRGRVALKKAETATSVGPDMQAVSASHREHQLFDMGGSSFLASRYCLRTDDCRIADDLSSLAGLRLPPNTDDFAEFAETSALHVVVETGLGRAECFTPFAGGTDFPPRTPTRELPEGWELRPVFAPCALFYPSSRMPVTAFIDGPF